MREIAPDVYHESKYPAVHLGLVVSNQSLLLVDSPIRLEDGRSWLARISEFGKLRYLVMLDHHPDRVVGARDMNICLIGHQLTAQALAGKSDSFKGSAHPIGAETDRIKRITGLNRSVPDLSFSSKMSIRLGKLKVELWHQPGPTGGSIWTALPGQGVVFIGDAVTLKEPPYLGDANIPDWIASLDELRSSHLQAYTMVSSRDGVIGREDINNMAKFLRKVKTRLEWLAAASDLESELNAHAEELLLDFPVPSGRVERARLRLRVGLEELYRGLHREEEP